MTESSGEAAMAEEGSRSRLGRGLAALIGAAQRVEHYEIAAYGTVRAMAEQLGENQAVDLLSQTLQESRAPLKVLREMLRVGRRAIVAFPNFGHWSVRLAHLFTGRAPKTRLFPHDWFDSPNIHFFTVDDFESLVQHQNWTIEKRIFLQGARQITILPNLLSEVAVFLVRS